MISFGVKDNFDAVGKSFEKTMGSQVPFATSLALNRTAQLAREALNTTMRAVFDRPTRYTLNSLYTKNSTKTDLTVIVGSKNSATGTPAGAYLRPEIEGGGRSLKSTEKLAGEFILPAKDTSLDQYGNIPGGTMRVLRQALQSGQTQFETSRGTYVIIRPNTGSKLKPGIYFRANNKVKISGRKGNKTLIQTLGAFKAVVFFNQHVAYQPRYDLEGVVNRVFQAELNRQFIASMDYALSTAKVRIPLS